MRKWFLAGQATLGVFLIFGAIATIDVVFALIVLGFALVVSALSVAYSRGSED